jgi:hypothetical protein
MDFPPGALGGLFAELLYSNEVNGSKEPREKKLNTFMLGQLICLSWCMLACLLPSCCCLLPSSSCLLPSFCWLLPSCSCVLPSRFPLPSQALCCTLPSFSLSAWSCTVTYRIGTKNIRGFLEKKIPRKITIICGEVSGKHRTFFTSFKTEKLKKYLQKSHNCRDSCQEPRYCCAICKKLFRT